MTPQPKAQHTAFTPGPWTVETDRGLFEAQVVGPPLSKTNTARPIMFQGDIGNARLIAAAPDLLEAAKEALASAEYVIQLVEANDKAGQSPNPFEKADWIGTCAHVYGAMAFVNKLRAAIARATS